MSAMVTYGTQTSAQTSPYCDKVRAQAGSKAALDMAPRAFAQALRYPGSAADLGAVLSNEFQIRVGLSLSLLKMLRGARLGGTSDADCRAHEARQAVEQLLANIDQLTMLPAYREQRAFLLGQRDSWHALIGIARERLERRFITVVDYNGLLNRTDALEARLVELQGTIEVLEASLSSLPKGSIETLVRNYVHATMDYERRASGLNAFDAWDFTVRGGAIPLLDGSPEWFGALELSYSLGGPISNSEESSYVEARAEELRRARYELPERARIVQQEMAARTRDAERALQLLDARIARLEQTYEILKQGNTASAEHARDATAVQQITLKSEQTFLRALIRALHQLQVRRDSAANPQKTRRPRQPSHG